MDLLPQGLLHMYPCALSICMWSAALRWWRHSWPPPAMRRAPCSGAQRPS